MTYIVYKRVAGAWKPLQRYQHKRSAIAVAHALLDLGREVIVRDHDGNEIDLRGHTS
jgi:hypothetical protein